MRKDLEIWERMYKAFVTCGYFSEIFATSSCTLYAKEYFISTLIVPQESFV